jgi:hypothetical protein
VRIDVDLAAPVDLHWRTRWRRRSVLRSRQRHQPLAIEGERRASHSSRQRRAAGRGKQAERGGRSLAYRSWLHCLPCAIRIQDQHRSARGSKHGSVFKFLNFIGTSGWGITRYWWTAIKLAITAALTVVVVGVLVPRLGAAADLAHTPHVFTLLEELPLAMAPALASSLLVINVALAIYKPRWRLHKSIPELSPSVAQYA